MNRIEQRPLQLISNSSIREYENDGDDQDRHYLPGRAAVEAAARTRLGQNVGLILPGHSVFGDYLALLADVVNDGRRFPVLSTSDTSYLMDTDIREELMPALFEMTEGVEHTFIHPYTATAEMHGWTNKLAAAGREITIFADEQDRNSRLWWGQKGAYHRWIDDLDTPSLAERLRLPFPHGFTAQNPDEVQRAIDLLGNEKVVLKPTFAAGGFTMGFPNSRTEAADYNWPEDPIHGGLMPVVVQERLNIAGDSKDEDVFSVQFVGNRRHGQITRQIMDGKEWVGNIVPATNVSEEFVQKAYDIVDRGLRGINPRGNGGFDFAQVKGSEDPVILEINGGRPTGAHGPKYLQEAIAPNAPNFIFQKVEAGSQTARGAMEDLRSAGVGYNKETQQGVLPMVWLQDMWCMFASFGLDFDQANRQLQIARNRLGV